MERYSYKFRIINENEENKVSVNDLALVLECISEFQKEFDPSKNSEVLINHIADGCILIDILINLTTGIAAGLIANWASNWFNKHFKEKFFSKNKSCHVELRNEEVVVIFVCHSEGVVELE